MEKQLQEKLILSKRVLITSHISPDPDALSSVLLFGTTLQKNYPDKNIKMVLEEEPEGLSFLAGYKNIDFKPLYDTLTEFQPDLLILLDGVNYERFSRQEGAKARSYVKERSGQLFSVIIDHHEPEGKDDTDIYIHQGSVATVQDVYEIVFIQLGLEKPEGYAETTMLGLYSDSGGFVYANGRHRQMFKLVSELLDAGVSLEKIKNRLNHYTEEHIKVIGELSTNLTSDHNYSYSFISDEFAKRWKQSGTSLIALNTGASFFVDKFIRSVDDRTWGFIVHPNLVLGNSYYSVSLRSLSGTIDVSKIANRLGGGGHKPAAGAKIQAQSIEEALHKVKTAIAEVIAPSTFV